VTPASGKSRGGTDFDPPPVSQPKRPEDEFVATALELANLADAPLHVRP
jgi:hypothetical protein